MLNKHDFDFDYDGVSQEENSLGIGSFDDLQLKLNDKKICVFLGAGFSKAWDEKYPLSDEVFSLSKEEAENHSDKFRFFSLFESFNLNLHPETVSERERAGVFKSFKYNLDVYRRYPSLLPSHLDKQTLDYFEQQIKNYVKNKFVGLLPGSEFKLDSKGAARKHKEDIIRFFNHLGNAKALDIITTNYDIVIDKVLRFSNPVRTQLRGFPIRINNEVTCPKKGGVGLYKLNGGFEVVADGEGFKIDYDSLSNIESCPNIILPSNDQNYSDKYFKNAFIKSSGQLRQADVLIFIGYSFPEEDYIIQFLLKSFLDADNKEKETIIVSRNEESALECHERACKLFAELNDKSGLYYYKGSFLELCAGA